MSQIFVLKDADVIEWTAASDVTADDLLDIGGKLGVALGSAAAGEVVSVKLTGVIRAAKGAEENTAGSAIGFNPAPTNTVGAAGSVANIGIVTEYSGSGESTVLVRLNG